MELSRGGQRQLKSRMKMCLHGLTGGRRGGESTKARDPRPRRNTCTRSVGEGGETGAQGADEWTLGDNGEKIRIGHQQPRRGNRSDMRCGRRLLVNRLPIILIFSGDRKGKIKRAESVNTHMDLKMPFKILTYKAHIVRIAFFLGHLSRTTRGTVPDMFLRSYSNS